MSASPPRIKCTPIDSDFSRLVNPLQQNYLRSSVEQPCSRRAAVARRKSLIEHAIDLSKRWWKLPASDRRAILNVLLEHIVVHQKSIDITIRLAGIPVIVRLDLDNRSLQSKVDGPTKLLSVAARLKRTGMETKLLIQGPLGPRNRKTDRSLLRLIGQAHRFAKILDAAEPGSTMTEIAKGASVSQSYFARVLRLNFLAPEITKMILQGRQPPELTANRIMKQSKLSHSWARQKKQLNTG